MIASQDSYHERGETEDNRTVDDPVPSGFSEERHNAPLTVSDEEVPLKYTQGGSYAELHLPQRVKATSPFRSRKRRPQIKGTPGHPSSGCAGRSLQSQGTARPCSSPSRTPRGVA
jgi:hypothetical protein